MDANLLGVGDDMIGGEVYGKSFTFTRKEFNEILALYNTIESDWVGRKLAWRKESGEITLI